MRSVLTRRQGTITVELALALPVLLYLLFGILEFGPLIKDYLTCVNAAREGARVAAVGATTDAIVARVQATAVGMDPDQLTVTMEYRTYEAGSGWSDWQPLGDATNGSRLENDAQIGRAHV